MNNNKQGMCGMKLNETLRHRSQRLTYTAIHYYTVNVFQINYNGNPTARSWAEMYGISLVSALSYVSHITFMLRWLPFALFSFRLLLFFFWFFVIPYFLVILIHLFIIFGAILQVLLESHVWPIANQSLMIWMWCIGDKGRKNTTKRGNMCMIRLAHNKRAPKWLPKWHKAPFH